jgi:hypothetical protein
LLLSEVATEPSIRATCALYECDHLAVLLLREVATLVAIVDLVAGFTQRCSRPDQEIDEIAVTLAVVALRGEIAGRNGPRP